MLKELPSEREVARLLLVDASSDFDLRVERLRYLLGIDGDFEGDGFLLTGGYPAYAAYSEARSSFVNGNFVATVLLSQALLEHFLGGEVCLRDMFEADAGAKPRRRRLRQLIDHAITEGVIRASDREPIERVIALRNPLAHHRGPTDPEELTMRAIQTKLHPEKLLYEDARLAITTVVRLVRLSSLR